MTITRTTYHQMWDRAVGVYGRRGAADFNARDLTEDTGVHHHVRAFIEEWQGDVFTHYGIFVDMDAETELEVAMASGTMVTATYTDPTTGWDQRVEVLELLADAAALVRNTDDAVVQVPASALSEPHREQGEDREYLPRTTMEVAR